MSTTDTEHEGVEQPPVEALETRPHVRAFEVNLETVGDGRTVEMQVVPYEVPALVRDGRGPTYREQFARGAFDRQIAVPERHKNVLLNFEHDQSIRGVVGHATLLADSDAGALAHFRMHDNSDGDKALQLVNEGVLRGASIEFAALKSRVVGGVVTRVRAHLDMVALCRNPAYAGAGVLAVREDELDLDDDDTDEVAVVKFEPVPLDAELEKRLEALGVDTHVRAFTSAAWDGSPSRWADAAAYCSACLIDDNAAGAAKVIAKCHLPVKEPGSGDVNVNAVRNALARVSQVVTSPANRSRARARLLQLLADAKRAGAAG